MSGRVETVRKEFVDTAAAELTRRQRDTVNDDQLRIAVIGTIITVG